MINNVYIKMTAFCDSDSNSNRDHPALQATTTMLRNVLHFLLDRIEGAYNITIYILFLHIDVCGNKFQALTHN